MMHRSDLVGVPGIAGVFSPADCRQTAQSIASVQLPSGEIPWSAGGHTDPWDHVECAMALTVAGLLDEARAAYEWSRTQQRHDGSCQCCSYRYRTCCARSDQPGQRGSLQRSAEICRLVRKRRLRLNEHQRVVELHVGIAELETVELPVVFTVGGAEKIAG